jgi:hypothetical protein
MCLQSRELREKRAQYLQQQAALKEAEAAKRCAHIAPACWFVTSLQHVILLSRSCELLVVWADRVRRNGAGSYIEGIHKYEVAYLWSLSNNCCCCCCCCVRLAESARRAELEKQQAAAKAAEYEAAALQELQELRARRAAAKKVRPNQGWSSEQWWL